MRSASAALRRSVQVRAQAVRFVLAGATVALFYIACTTFLSKVTSAPFQLALAIGFVAAIALHFTLQRFFVWAQEAQFALSVRHQLGRYLTIATLQYLVTAAATATLPGVVALSTFQVYLVTTAVVSVANFLIFRSSVFHADDDATGPNGRSGESSAVTP
jgi:putative flippase GtrA